MTRLLASFLFFLTFQVAALAVEQPGPSASLLANPIYSGGIGLLYQCQMSYYVSTSGNDANPGTMAQPWKTIQHADAAGIPQAGTCINVEPGTYTWTSTFTPIHGGNSSSPTGYVVYRCQVLDQCFIVYDGPAGGVVSTVVIALTNPYYIWDGFDVDGGEEFALGGLASVCFDSSLADTGTPGHHLWILNNNMHGCGLAGVTFNDSEFYFVIHNNITDTAWWSQYQGSGVGYVVLKRLGDNLSPYPPYVDTVYDQAFAPFHNMVSWNHVYNNGCLLCLGTISALTSTANTNSTSTLSAIANLGTSASFTGAISGEVLTVTGITGTISVGDSVLGAGTVQSTFILPFGTMGTTGTGGNGTYYLSLPYAVPVSSEAMTSASIAQSVLVTGPGIQPFTYVNTVAGNSVTLTRPALTAQSGGTFTFYTEANGHTDGNGIIMDTWCSVTCGGTGTQPYDYTNAQTLVSFNDVQFNGGRCVHLFAVFNATAINNSCYHDGLDIYLTAIVGELSQQGGVNNNWFSNISYAVPNFITPCLQNNAFPSCNFSIVGGDARGVTDTNIQYFNNMVFDAGGVAMFNNDAIYWSLANNKDKSDPLYINETSQTLGNLQLQFPQSPAIGYAYPKSFAYIPRGTTDAGAWQTGGLRLTNVVGGFTPFTGDIGFQTLKPIPTALTCTEATAWLNYAVTVEPYDRVHHDAYSNLICGMVNAGLWCGSTLDILYVFSSYNQTLANINLCSANYASPTFTAVPHGSPTWTANQGYTGVNNSSIVYIDTGFNPTTAGGNYSANSAEVSMWSNNDVAASGSGGYAIGALSPGGVTILYPYTSNGGGGFNYEANVNNNIFNFTAITNQPTGLGHFLAQRTTSTDVAAYFNAVQQFAYTQTVDLSDSNIFILAYDNGGTPGGGSPIEAGIVTIGPSYTPTTQIGTLCHLFNVYSTAINSSIPAVC